MSCLSTTAHENISTTLFQCYARKLFILQVKGSDKLVWSKSGQQSSDGDDWKKADPELPGLQSDFQVKPRSTIELLSLLKLFN